MLSHAGTVYLINNPSSIDNLWYLHVGVVSSSHILTPYDTGTPNLLAKIEFEFSMAPACGTVMLILMQKIGFTLIFSCFS